MIQRIQSLYLFLAAVFTVLVFFLPTWTWTAVSGDLFYRFGTFGVTTNAPQFSSPLWIVFLLVLTAGGAVFLLLWGLFSYKTMVRQIALTVGAEVLLAAYYAVLIWQWCLLSPDLPSGAFDPGLAILFPAIAFVFGILAVRGVNRDRRLLKAADRIR